MRPANLVVGVGGQASKWALLLCNDGGRWWGQEVWTAGRAIVLGQETTAPKAEV